MKKMNFEGVVMLSQKLPKADLEAMIRKAECVDGEFHINYKDFIRMNFAWHPSDGFVRFSKNNFWLEQKRRLSEVQLRRSRAPIS